MNRESRAHRRLRFLRRPPAEPMLATLLDFLGIACAALLVGAVATFAGQVLGMAVMGAAKHFIKE